MTFTQSLTNTTYTQNMALSNKSSLSACLDLFSMGVSSSDKQSLIKAALLEDLPLAIKTVMYLRDTRGGQGSKDIARAFHSVVKSLLVDDNFFFSYIELLPYLPEIGSWKDVYALYGLSPDLDPYILKLLSEYFYDAIDRQSSDS